MLPLPPSSLGTPRLLAHPQFILHSLALSTRLLDRPQSNVSSLGNQQTTTRILVISPPMLPLSPSLSLSTLLLGNFARQFILLVVVGLVLVQCHPRDDTLCKSNDW